MCKYKVKSLNGKKCLINNISSRIAPVFFDSPVHVVFFLRSKSDKKHDKGQVCVCAKKCLCVCEFSQNENQNSDTYLRFQMKLVRNHHIPFHPFYHHNHIYRRKPQIWVCIRQYHKGAHFRHIHHLFIYAIKSSE